MKNIYSIIYIFLFVKIAQSSQKCHYTCSECSGPTIFDCVQCFPGAELFVDQRYCKCKDEYYFYKGKCIQQCPEDTTILIEKDNKSCLDKTLLLPRLLVKQKADYNGQSQSPKAFICDNKICTIQGFSQPYFDRQEYLSSGFSLEKFTTDFPYVCNNQQIIGGEARSDTKITLNFEFDQEYVRFDLSFKYFAIDHSLKPVLQINFLDFSDDLKYTDDSPSCGDLNIMDKSFIFQTTKYITDKNNKNIFNIVMYPVYQNFENNNNKVYFGIRDFMLQIYFDTIPNCQNQQDGKCSYCNSGYYLSSNICLECGFLCKTCKTRNECESCFDLYYLHQELKTCFLNCNQYPYYIEAGKCKCIMEQNKCVNQCPDGCDLCISRYTCKKCSPGKYLYNNTCLNRCPNGYNNDDNETCTLCISSSSCFNCHPSCKTCNNNSSYKESCTSCYDSRKLTTNQTCSCLQDKDKRYTYFECNQFSSVLLDISLSSINPEMIINFGEEISFNANIDTNSSTFCKSIFSNTTLYLVGLESQCRLDKDQITVILVNSKVVNGQIIKLKEDLFSFQRNSWISINTYYNEIIKQDQLTEINDVQFQYYEIINTCRQIEIKLDMIKGDSKRGFLQFNWFVSLKTNNDEILNKIEKLIIDANNNQLTDLIIPVGIIPPDFTLTFIFDYKFLNGATGKKVIDISVVSKIVVYINLLQSIPNHILVYQQLDMLFFYTIETCNENLEIVTVQEPVNVQIISDQSPVLAMKMHLKDQQEFQYSIDPYILQPNSVTSLKVNVFEFSINKILLIQQQVTVLLESNQLFQNTQEFIIYSEQSDLIVKIEGSNRQQDYRQKFIISGYSRDLDLKDENQDQGITLNWSCYDIIKQSSCVNQKGEKVELQQVGSELIVFPNTFESYLSLIFKLEGTKGNRKSYQSVTVMLSELNIPNLKVQLEKQNTANNKVNLNEEIIAVLDYDPTVNTDILTFTGAILYNDSIVGVIKFDYTKVRFQVWDYFQNFDPNQTKFLVRFSVYNPQYIMPSLSVQQFEINLPPSKCKFIVNPLNGISLQTKFNFSLSNCEDKDQPIKYQFFYYSSEEQYKFEIINPLLIQRKQISDIQMKQFTSVSLPPGDLIVMGIAIDSRNAIQNITEKIHVTKKDYQKEEYLALINSYISKNQQSPEQNSYDLSLLSQDFSCREEFHRIQELNQKIPELINKLVELLKQLPPSSTFSNLINKSILSLQQKIVSSSPQWQQLRIDQIKEQLQPLENLNLNKNNQNRDTLKEGLYDQFKILDSIKMDEGNKKYEEKVIQISDTISKLMNKISLPNEDKKEFIGNNYKILSEKITYKYLNEYFCCGSLKDLLSESTKNEQTIYDISFSRFKQNPYLQDDSFQQQRNEVLKKIKDLQLKNYEVIQPSITTQNQKQVLFNQNFVYQFQMNETDQNLACVTKFNNLWTKEGCQIVYQKQIGYQCQCQQISPTTLIVDVADIFEGKNLQTAFGNQGIKNLQDFNHFYYYIAFWVLVLKSQVVIALVVYGRKLDSTSLMVYDNIKLNKILPISNINMSMKNRKRSQLDFILKDKIKSLNFLDFIKVEKLGLKIQNLNKEDKSPQIQYKLENIPSTEQENIDKNSPCDQYGSNDIQLQQIKDLQKQASTILLTQCSSDNMKAENYGAFGLEKEINLDSKNKQNSMRNQPNLNSFSAQDQDKLLNISLIKQILYFHGFFSIFYVYDPSLSRAERFITFYIRMVHSLTVSIVFNENYSTLQVLVISIINALIIQIFIVVFLKLASNQRIKIFSMIFIIIIAGGFCYIILSIVSGQSVIESNEFFIPYCIIIALDLLVVSSLSAIASRQIALTVINQRLQTSCSKKLAELLQLPIIIKNLNI